MDFYEDDARTPHIVVVRFDREHDSEARVTESASLLVEALEQLGPTQCIAVACDGSMSAFLVSTKGPPGEIYALLQAPRGIASAVNSGDTVGVFSIESAVIPNFAPGAE